ncbi:MAG: DUF695 domain-containing protein [Dokdonella sp.]
MIPEPHYTLINTSKGKDPAVVVVNSALRNFQNRASFPWHLEIKVSCKNLGANGMPTTEETEILHQLESGISNSLQVQREALFLARITCRGKRELIYRVRDSKTAGAILQQCVTDPLQLREWSYLMKQDVAWELAQAELNLLVRDNRFN